MGPRLRRHVWGRADCSECNRLYVSGVCTGVYRNGDQRKKRRSSSRENLDTLLEPKPVYVLWYARPRASILLLCIAGRVHGLLRRLLYSFSLFSSIISMHSAQRSGRRGARYVHASSVLKASADRPTGRKMKKKRIKNLARTSFSSWFIKGQPHS